jgi:hypothetical protein
MKATVVDQRSSCFDSSSNECRK